MNRQVLDLTCIDSYSCTIMAEMHVYNQKAKKSTRKWHGGFLG